MILGGNEIRQQLCNGRIFRDGTWADGSIKEASYALRIADDGLLIDGKFFDPGKHYPKAFIEIAPGQIAILSTIERMNMPKDLVGKLGIRLKYALQGLTGFMGIQVDPLYGFGKECERLFIRVANFGNESIRLMPGDEVFTFELQEVSEIKPSPSKEDTWLRIKNELRHQSNLSWSYVTRVEHDLSEQTGNIRDNLQPLVMFGVVLVAVTILGVVIVTLLRLPNPAEVETVELQADWEQLLMLGVLSLGALATAWVGFVAGWRFLRPYGTNRSRQFHGSKGWRWLRPWSWRREG